MNLLILAAGEGRPRWLLRRLARQADWIIAADGGSRLARRARLTVNQFVGDGDSLTRRERSWLEGAPFPVRWHPVAKDETDLELALTLALEEKPAAIEVFGGWGARADHTLSNLYLLERAERAGVRTFLWAGSERLRLLLPGSHRLSDALPGQRVSLVPISSTVEAVSTAGLRFALEAKTLHRPAGRGVSNQVVSVPAGVRFSRGVLSVIQAFSRATLPR